LKIYGKIGKRSDRSAPIGLIYPVEKIGHFPNGAISPELNGVVAQKANLSFMMLSVAEQISRPIIQFTIALELKAALCI
jgi:fumarylpyruvate hydrolase